MDVSKEYILMCEKATEVQNERFIDFFAGDWYISNNGYPFVMGSKMPLTDDLHRRGETWLPRQDQLQDMIKNSWGLRTIERQLLNIHRFVIDEVDEHNRFYHSMEQFWLAFVMKEKYKKIWNGKEWEINI